MCSDKTLSFEFWRIEDLGVRRAPVRVGFVWRGSLHARLGASELEFTLHPVRWRGTNRQDFRRSRVTPPEGPSSCPPVVRRSGRRNKPPSRVECRCAWVGVAYLLASARGAAEFLRREDLYGLMARVSLQPSFCGQAIGVLEGVDRLVEHERPGAETRKPAMRLSLLLQVPYPESSQSHFIG